MVLSYHGLITYSYLNILDNIGFHIDHLRLVTVILCSVNSTITIRTLVIRSMYNNVLCITIHSSIILFASIPLRKYKIFQNFSNRNKKFSFFIKSTYESLPSSLHNSSILRRTRKKLLKSEHLLFTLNIGRSVTFNTMSLIDLLLKII